MSHRESIVKNIITVLEDMSPPRPVFVSREPVALDKLSIAQFPALIVQASNEVRADNAMGGKRRGVLNIEIRAYVRSDGRKGMTQTVDEKRNDLIERIEEALNSDRTRELNAAQAATTHVTEIEIIDRDPPLGEVLITCEVHYSFTKGAL
jgi:hypothetical protein